MDVKIRHKFIKIEDRVSDRFVILITNYRWLRIKLFRIYESKPIMFSNFSEYFC